MSSYESESDGTEATAIGDVLPFTFKIAFEVDFLVAQARPGVQYPLIHNEDGQFNELKYVVPARASVDSALHRCALVLGSNGEHLAVHPNGTRIEHIEAQIQVNREHWHVSVSPMARVVLDSPPNYNWLPVRLRTPFLRDRDMIYGRDIHMALGILRNEVRMHVNSTCALRVMMRIGPEPIGLGLAKRLITEV
ncbi:hypothetical protein VHEMI08422 [[Torrubiella] hemipterigena]|uniref:Uncharacterized protein n=1 Tax=[Torrubiella] hemipterigena TaxID=1531966 RepID=A0A0A1TPP5_9HYPO|nr:hypothetical protein VHEMI08422 [[Torrubiella] hemipterigena]